MSQMNQRGMKGLNQVRRMRQDKLEEMGQSYQRQQAHTHKQGEQLQMLGELYDTCQVVNGESALAWQNRSTIRDSLQHLAKVQAQQLALAQSEQRRLQQDVVKQHVSVKTLETVIGRREKQQLRVEARQEQKLSDEMAMQSYLRNVQR
ncbi:flagellar export protein FliJ [Thaumasiovibrio sp. DFM-14]|uniref:flagellar export protein FliJ n=1 Tax=Thaumasiovibrio sp. DFM-14 TaxID=3384792 RepID=UPI0039A2901B